MIVAMHSYCLCSVTAEGTFPIVLAFHHIAQHELQKKRNMLGTMWGAIDPSMYDSCRAVINMVFFNKQFYDCDVNNEGIAELVTVLQAPH